MGTVSIEDFASAAGEGRRWFQLYLWKDRARSLALVERAWEAGFDTLLVTADTAVAGARLRDLHSGTTMPPALTVRSIVDTVMHPAWLFDLVTTEPLVYASLNGESGSVEEMARTMFDQTVDVDDLAWLRDAWKGALVVKGVQSVTDARRFADAGVDGVVLSSHGGRQLDRTAAPFHVLPRVRDELGDRISVLLDTGIRHGQDVVAALALGADFTLVGRAHMYGLMAGGRPGVQRAVDILRTQIDRTMRLLGVTSFAQLDSRHVTQLRRGVSSAEPTRHR
jgi:isopentenyl diphosphate isomerase/L-lactate dehydrogenase-like FMN-dependent dehydrogenase